MSIGNVLSGAYCMSSPLCGSRWPASLHLAGAVLLLCGKDLVDLSEFKKGAAGDARAVASEVA